MEFPAQLLRSLNAAHSITVLTGAGISAESGIPTFREAQTGLWARYNPLELATPEAFRRDPALVWRWYAWRRNLIRDAEPNPGHLALSRLERSIPNFTLITQNVDGLHQQAGSENVIELHGNIFRTICSAERGLVPERSEDGEIPPTCPHCGAPLRPDVVWFGESLPAGAIASGLKAAEICTIFFSIGTSALVQPAASFPKYAHRAGALLVEINPAPTPVTPSAAYALQGPAGEVLPELIGKAWPGLE